MDITILGQNTGTGETNLTHFCSHVLPVQSAYSFAAGSVLPSIPRRCGVFPSLLMPSFTSASNVLAMLFARMTLQAVAGGLEMPLVVMAVVGSISV